MVTHVYLYNFNTKATMVNMSIKCTHLGSLLSTVCTQFCAQTVRFYAYNVIYEVLLEDVCILYFHPLLTRHTQEPRVDLLKKKKGCGNR